MRRATRATQDSPNETCCVTQACMATAAAAEALIERVDPNWLISTTASHASIASAESPGPSCPKSMMHRSGNANVSMITEPGKEITWGEVHVGARQVFEEAGFTQITHPTKRRVVMRIEFA